MLGLGGEIGERGVAVVGAVSLKLSVCLLQERDPQGEVGEVV